MKTQWTTRQINDWYAKLPWLRGSNFLPSNAVNRLDMWQSHGRDEHLAVADRELRIHKELGFNSVRLWINFDAYYAEPEEFMLTLESYVALSAKHGQSVMLVLAYEEDLPFGDRFVPAPLGEQKLYFNHFNRDYELLKKNAESGAYRHYAEYPEIKPVFFEMIEKVVQKYRADERILAWNIINEPGHLIGDRIIPIMRELFERVRALDPVQPLAADVNVAIKPDGTIPTEVHRVAYELSDFMSYHCYDPYDKFIEQLFALKKHYDRPVIMTEWLQRCLHSNVAELYPLMLLENVGCYCWGFVGGETRTTEPSSFIWDKLAENPNADIDVTKWQHDLYRRDGHPYDPKEIAVIKKTNALADASR